MLRLCYMSSVSRPTSTSFRVETSRASMNSNEHRGIAQLHGTTLPKVFPLDLS